jgi:hypothetical protein
MVSRQLAPVRLADPPVADRHVEAGSRSPLPRVKLSSQGKTRLKLGLSVVMIAGLFLFGKIDLSKSWEVAKSANPWFLLAAFLMFLCTTVLNAHRWQLLARAVGFERPLLKLVQYCFVGNFFNLFLPSTVGGDFSRCYYLCKGEGRYHHALYSVLADRVVGIAVLFAFASFGILIGPGGGGLPWHLKLPVLAGTVALFVLIPTMPALTLRLLGPENKIAQRFNNSMVQRYWRDRPLIAMTLFLSVCMQLVIVLCHIAVGFALGLTSIPVWYYLVFYPSVAVLGFVTPSFNGIGIREWAYTYFLTLAGVDRSHALAYAITWLGLNTLFSLTGGLVYLGAHLKINQAEAEALQYDTI